VNLNSDDTILIDSEEDIEINAVRDVHIGDDYSRNVVILPGGTLYLKYAAADMRNWAGKPPEYVWDALNRIASALAALGKIP